MDKKNQLYLIIILIIIILINYIIALIYMKTPEKRIVIFDLDETLGSFTELGIFYDALESYYSHKLTKKDFFNLLELYPEFLRPNIIKILSYLKSKKVNGTCDKIIIYTNNQGPKNWAQNIRKYFEEKLNYKLFDRVIAAYKIGGKQIEKNRSTHDKSAKDFFNCTKFSKDSKLCFIDDQYHPFMNCKNVYYINVQPYASTIPYQIMINRYYEKNTATIHDRELFNRKMLSVMNKYHFNHKILSDDNSQKYIIASINLLKHLQLFFNTFKNNKTKKKKDVPVRNITIKI